MYADNFIVGCTINTVFTWTVKQISAHYDHLIQFRSMNLWCRYKHDISSALNQQLLHLMLPVICHVCFGSGVVGPASLSGPDAGARAVPACISAGAPAAPVPEAVWTAVLHRSSDAALPAPLKHRWSHASAFIITRTAGRWHLGPLAFGLIPRWIRAAIQ